MANFCLMPEAITRFKKGLIDGTIDPGKLANMSSEERRALFTKMVGEDAAKQTNALFESKLLLKNQQRGMITWAKQVSGITPEIRRDLITRIQKMERVLDPPEQEQFLRDLASTKLKVDVTQAEATKIAKMAKKIETLKAEANDKGIFKSEDARLNYGRAKVALGNYMEELKNAAEKPTLKSLAMHPGKTATATAGVAKSTKAAFDNSAIFRQGWKTLWTNPIIWQKNARKTFSDAIKVLGNKNALDEVHADILSRPNYEKYRKAGLAVSTIEEAYPSSLPGKVPVLGRLYRASEASFEGFVYRQRADVFDKYMEIAERTGVNIEDPKQLKAIGKLVNALTGRGHLGGLEPAASTVNNWFFSPRFLKSNIDLLTAHQFQKNVTPFVRKQAAKNLLKVIVGTASVLAIADMVLPGSVEKDPRSSNFGKIKVGDTRFDVTGGISSILVLGARLLTQSTKTSSGVSKLNSGFGSQTGTDVITQFFSNKLSPAASILKDIMDQEDFNGNKPTVLGEAKNLFAPLPITTFAELKKDPNSANIVVAMIADMLGIATNTYGRSVKNWDTHPTKNQAAFKDKVSAEDFKKANARYNGWVDRWTRDNWDKLQAMQPEDRASTVTAAKQKIEKQVMKDAGYTPPKVKKNKAVTQQKKSMLEGIGQ